MDMDIETIKMHLGNYYCEGITMPEECIKELFFCLDELKIFRQLYPEKNYKQE